MFDFKKWKNYQAWNVNVNEFPHSGTTRNQLFFLTRYAVLAPSSHNSQPWQFTIRENSIAVSLVPKRLTPVADPSQRFAHIAIGCALENILIAGDYFGFETKTEYFPRGEGSIAKVSFTKKSAAESSPDHLIFSISQRLSNRYPYKSDPLPASFLKKVKSLSDQELRIDFVEDKAAREQLAVIIADAREAEFDEPAFRREIATWKRTNWTHSPLGMPGFTMGFPTLLSFIAPTAIKYMNPARKMRPKDIAIFTEHTPAAAIISSREDARERWIQSGQLFERIALEATRAGLATNIMAAAIGYGEYYKKIQTLLNSTYRPQFLFRIGYAKQPMLHSPRLTAEKVAILA